MPYLRLLLAVVTLFLANIAWAGSKSATAYYEDAIRYYNQEEYASAVIQLKNALQENPRLLPAIVLLGEAYLRTGNAAAAQTAFQDAIDAGADISALAIPLANSYLGQFKHELLLAQDVPRGLPADTLAELHTIRAQAALEINDTGKYLKELKLAEDVDPSRADLLFLKLSNHIRKNEITDAEILAGQLNALYPDTEATFLALASLAHAKGMREEAATNYTKVLELNPENIEARLAKVGILLDLARTTETEAELDQLDKSLPNDPRAMYLRSILYGQQGALDQQREQMLEALALLDGFGTEIVIQNPQFSLISGMANYKLGNNETSRTFLENYIKQAGRDPVARSALLDIYVSAKQFKDAIEIGEGLINENRVTLDLVKLITQSYHAIGEHDKAVFLLDRITKVLKEPSPLDIQLALSRIQGGFVERGITELETLYLIPELKNQAAMPLAVNYLERLEFLKASVIAEDLVSQDPKNISHLNLLGLALVGLGQLEQARSQFESIVKLTPENIAAHLNLAKIDSRTGNFDAATERLNKLAQENPNNAQIAVALSRTYLRQNNQREAIKWGKEAQKISPDSIATSRYLTRLLLTAGNLDEAENNALTLEQLYPNNLDAMEMVAHVLNEKNENKQLRAQLRSMAGVAGANPEWLYKIAQYQAAANDTQEATYSLFKALRENPQYLDAQTLLVSLELQLDRNESAEKRAREIIANHSQETVGYLLLGDIFFDANAFSKATEQYQQARSLDKNTTTTLKLFIAQRAQDDQARAMQTLSSHLDHYPQDQRVRAALAEYQMRLGEYKEAEINFLEMLELAPNNSSLLNNLANLYLRLDQSQKAKDYALKAHALNPSSPYINDTLGWLYTLAEDYEQGIGYLREALARASNNPEIRYHLAKNLAGQGRSQEAKQELKKALNSGQSFEGIEDAKQLLKTLEG